MSSVQPVSLDYKTYSGENKKRKDRSPVQDRDLKSQKFEEVSLLEFPDPLLVKIFIYTQEALPTLRLTCKLWKEKIDTTPDLLSRYWLSAAKKLSYELKDYYSSVGEALIRLGNISEAEKWALDIPCTPETVKARVDLFYSIALYHLHGNPSHSKKNSSFTEEKKYCINVEKSNRSLEFRKKAIKADADLFRHQEFAFTYLNFCIHNKLFFQFTLFLSELDIQEHLDDALMSVIPLFIQNWGETEMLPFKQHITNPKNLRVTIQKSDSNLTVCDEFHPLNGNSDFTMESFFPDPDLSFFESSQIKNELNSGENSIETMSEEDEIPDEEKTDFDVFYSTLACALFEKGYEEDAKRISENIFGQREKEQIVVCEIKKAIQTGDLQRAKALLETLNENLYAMCDAAIALAKCSLVNNENEFHHYISSVKEKSLEASNEGYNFIHYWKYMLQVIILEYKNDFKESSIKENKNSAKSYKTLITVLAHIVRTFEKESEKQEYFFTVFSGLKNNRLIGLLKFLRESDNEAIKKYSSIMLEIYDLDAKATYNFFSQCELLSFETRFSYKLKYLECNFTENQSLGVFIKEVREFISTVNESKHLETISYKLLVYTTKYLERDPKLANIKNKLITETIDDMYKLATGRGFRHFEGIIAYLYLLLKDSKKATEFLQKGDSHSKMVAFLQNKINEFEPRRVLKNE